MSEDFEDAKPVRRGPMFEDTGPVERGRPFTFSDILRQAEFDRYGEFPEAEDWEELAQWNDRNETIPVTHDVEDYGR